MRFLFPDDRLSYLIGTPSTALMSAEGQRLRVYLDADGAHPATDLLSYPDQVAISSGVVTVDGNSEIPLFYGPDGVQTLYMGSILGGAIYPVSAGLAQRIDTFPAEQNTFTFMGPLFIRPGTAEWYVETACTWGTGRLAVGQPPTGSSLIVDVKCNGSTIYTNTANRPTLTSGARTQVSATPDITAFSAGSYFTVDVVQIGSTFPGDTMTYGVRLYPA